MSFQLAWVGASAGAFVVAKSANISISAVSDLAAVILRKADISFSTASTISVIGVHDVALDLTVSAVTSLVATSSSERVVEPSVSVVTDLAVVGTRPGIVSVSGTGNDVAVVGTRPGVVVLSATVSIAYTYTRSSEGNKLMLENGTDAILLENGTDRLLLE